MTKAEMGVKWDLVSVYVVVVVAVSFSGILVGGITSSFVRNEDLSLDMPLDSDVFRVPPGYNAPQQVHITQGAHEGNSVIVSWVTQDAPGSKSVIYWAEHSKHKNHADGFIVRYKYFNYTSGYIHHCSIKDLKFDTKYYYEVGRGNVTRTFWFVTPPKPGPDVPYTFGLIGDLGQTHDSNRTLTHYEFNPTKGQTVLFVGDLSYADDYPFHDNVRWDTWASFVERIAAYQSWVWTAGNHEIDFAPQLGKHVPFKPYFHRFHVPYRASGKYTPQYKWLEQEFPKVNRTETPWLIVLMHCPMYNSYVGHYMEGETMRVIYEAWFVEYKVDVVFARHVHAYERSKRVSNVEYNIVNGLCTPVYDQSAPVYITIGDGGNLEGLVTQMAEPQPGYSAFREASFGHGLLDIKNRTHARFSWHRNQDGYAVEADFAWLINRYWYSLEESLEAEL